MPSGAPADLDFPHWDAFLRLAFSAKNKTMRATLGSKNVVAALAALRHAARGVSRDGGGSDDGHDGGASTALAAGAFDDDASSAAASPEPVDGCPDEDSGGEDREDDDRVDGTNASGSDGLTAPLLAPGPPPSSPPSRVATAGGKSWRSAGGGLLDNLTALRRAARGFAVPADAAAAAVAAGAAVKTVVGAVDRDALLAARAEVLGLLDGVAIGTVALGTAPPARAGGGDGGGGDLRPNAMAVTDFRAVFDALYAAGFRFLSRVGAAPVRPGTTPTATASARATGGTGSGEDGALTPAEEGAL